MQAVILPAANNRGAQEKKKNSEPKIDGEKEDAEKTSHFYPFGMS